MDQRATKLAQIFINHSLKVKANDHLVISVSDFSPLNLLQETYRLALERGAHVYLDVMGLNWLNLRADYGGLMNTFLKKASKRQLQEPLKLFEQKIDWADKYLRIVSIHNKNFLADVDLKKLNLWKQNFYPQIHKIIKKDWLLTYFPTQGMAQDAHMSYEDLLDYYYSASSIDYQSLNKRISKLQSVLDKGTQVHIVAAGTDLKLGIKSRLAQGTDSGTHNIPDGECFLGPEENKTEGYITFEYPQSYMGSEISGIKLEFKKGKVIKYSAQTGQKQLESLLEDHPGNKILGELGIGMNYKIKKYMKEIIFDEKIAGTIHLALGNSYENKRGGGKNKGTIHWDIIKDLRHKGSKMLVDNKIIIKDGQVLV